MVSSCAPSGLASPECGATAAYRKTGCARRETKIGAAGKDALAGFFARLQMADIRFDK